MNGEQKLRAAIRRFRQRRADIQNLSRAKPRDLQSQIQSWTTDPTNPFEVAVNERLKHLEAELARLQARLNWLFTVILGAAITNVVITLLS